MGDLWFRLSGASEGLSGVLSMFGIPMARVRGEEMGERRVPQRFVVRIVGESGRVEIDQADSLTEAREMKTSIEAKRPGTKVNFYKSESGLAIFDGWMNEILK